MNQQEKSDTEEILSGLLGEKSSWSLYSREQRTPMTFVLAEAEQMLKAPVNLYWVDGYSPEIFCLKDRPEPVVVFSTRFLEIWTDLRRIVIDDILAPGLKERIIAEHALRLIAEYALSMDDPEFAAVVSIEAAMRGAGVMYMPNTLESLEYEPISIRYMFCWFFTLCHEIGHFTVPANLTSQISDQEITELVHESLADLQLSPEWASSTEQRIRSDPDRFLLGINRIRSELNSDLFASFILFVCTQKILKEVQNGEKFSWTHYLLELGLSLNLIALIDRCRRIAAYSCTAEPSDRVTLEAILQPAAISVRLSLLYRRFIPFLKDLLYDSTPAEEETQQFHHFVDKVLYAMQEFTEVVNRSLNEVYQLTLDRTNRGTFVAKVGEYQKALLEDAVSINNVDIQILLERAAKFERWSPIFTSLKQVMDNPARPIEYPVPRENFVYLAVGIKGSDGSNQVFGLPTRYGYTVFLFLDSVLFAKFFELSEMDLAEGYKLEKVALVVASTKHLRYAVATRLPVGTNAHLVIEGTEAFPRYMHELSSGEIFE